MTGSDLLNPPNPAGQSWRDRIKVHPAADAFPMMSDAELVALGKDIEKNGLRSPIAFHTDAPRPEMGASYKYKRGDAFDRIIWAKRELKLPLLDGRNRLAAMEAVGILSEERLAALISSAGIHWGNDISPEDFVLTANLHRRHLTAEQKRELIEKLLKAQPEKSDRQIAVETKTSHPKVARVRKKLEQAGDVERRSTRTDTKGRAQPTTKQKAAPTGPSPGFVRALIRQKELSAQVMGRLNATVLPATAPKPEPDIDNMRRTYADAVRKLSKEERLSEAHRVVIDFGLRWGDFVISHQPPAAAPTEPKPAQRQPDKRDLSEKIVAALNEVPGLTRTALNARTGAYGYQIEQAIETGVIVERDGALYAGGAA
jgi:DNA-binding Lrp family transcriptional regulator